MKQSILYKLTFLTLVFSFLVGMGAHVALLVSGAEDSPLERWRLLGFGLAAVALLALLLLLRYWQRRQAALNQAERQLYSLAPRPGRDLKVCDFWQRAPGDYVSRSRLDLPCEHISLELGGDHHQVFFSLSTPPDIAKGILTQASQEWPKVEIRRLAAAAADISPAEQNETLVDAPRRPASAQPGASPTWRWQTLTLAQPDFHPLRTEDIRFGQPQHPSRVGGLLAEVEALPVGTIGGIQLLTRPAPASKRQSWGWRANLIRRQLHNRGSHSQTRTQEGETASVRYATSRQYGPANPDQLQAELARITSRLDDRSLHEVCLRVWACGPKAESEVQRLSTAVISQTRSSWNQLAVEQKGEDAAPVIGRHFPTGGGFVMTGAELGQMLYLPNQEEAGPYARLHTAGAEPLAPEGKIIVAREETILADGLLDGLTPVHVDKRFYGVHVRSGSEENLVGHSFADATMHTFICGATGAGKSVLGANLVLQDWRAGHAALVIDPHRSLIDDILRGVPTAREKDVIVLDPGDQRQPFRFNLFDVGQGKDTAVERLMAALRAGMEVSWDSSVGMQEVLFHALTLTLHGPEPSMLRLLDWLDERQRARLLPDVTAASPQVQQAVDFWRRQFPAWNGQDQKRAVGAARRRVENFTRRGLVRRTLGMTGSTVNLAEAFNSGKLILCPMHDEMGEETKRIWSMLLLQELIALLLGRQPGANLPRVTVVIDELAESVGTLAEFVGVLLNETRKYGAAAILMNQSYVGLPPEMRQVIIGNCRSQIVLSLGAEDAEVAARIMGSSVTAEDVQRLRPYHAYAQLAVGGGQSAPCQIRTYPPLKSAAEPEPQPKPSPPAGIADANPPAPRDLGAHLDTLALLAWAQRVDPQRTAAADRLLAALKELPEEQYAALCRLRQDSNAWWASQVLAAPGIMMDKVGRIKTLSQWRYGIPWWQSDADFMRAAAAAEDARMAASAETGRQATGRG
ncbi:MAG: type IV secretion system DNA-binding domain-containing protein [Chloroflexi bacterium]|nr:type IV secretion system DNA-binding domain-containing protein [Chloroflexota bacterium]